MRHTASELHGTRAEEPQGFESYRRKPATRELEVGFFIPVEGITFLLSAPVAHGQG